MTLSRLVSEITWWWSRKHPPMSRIPEWKKLDEAEKRARRRGCTQDIGRASKGKRAAVTAALMRELPHLEETW